MPYTIKHQNLEVGRLCQCLREVYCEIKLRLFRFSKTEIDLSTTDIRIGMSLYLDALVNSHSYLHFKYSRIKK